MVRLPLVLALSMLALACGRIEAYEQELRARELAAATRARPPKPRVVAARTLHVRAYADADFRAEHANWRAPIEEIIEAASLLLQPQLDVALELDGSREWQRECDLRTPRSCLAELTRLDEGGPDVWVVAFTSALPQMSRDLDTLGHAEPLGRHVLLHGMSHLDEQDTFDMPTGELRAAQRRALERERGRHKQAVALLHAWGHTLGSLHGGDASTVMHASYAPEQAAFTPDTTELLQIMLDARLRGDSEAALRTGYRTWLEQHPRAFASEEHDARLAELHDTAAVAPAREREAQDLSATNDAAMQHLTEEDRALLEAALERARGGNRDGALASVAQVAERYPDVAPVQRWACELGVTSSCERASQTISASP